MSDRIGELAARVREMRMISKLTPESLAADLGISPAALQEYESGRSDIPISFLYSFAARFGLEMSALLTGEEPRLHLYTLVRKGRGVSVDRRKDYRYSSLAHNFVGKRAEPFLVTADPWPENRPSPVNSHAGQEFNYVLSGRLEVTVDGHALVLEEGDSLYFDSSAPHGMRALDNRPAHFIAVVI